MDENSKLVPSREMMRTAKKRKKRKREGRRGCLIVCCDVEGINRGSTEATKFRQPTRVLKGGRAGTILKSIAKVLNAK